MSIDMVVDIGRTPTHLQRLRRFLRIGVPLGGVIVRDQLMDPFSDGPATFLHGVTFAGHPVSCAVALANLDVFEKEDLLGNVRAHEDAFRATLEKLKGLELTDAELADLEVAGRRPVDRRRVVGRQAAELQDLRLAAGQRA